jgi:hypothetical protein
MLTKYTITIGTTEYDVPDECLANWDEISFSLKRTDYSGVMRSYSTQFVFVGTIRDLLWEHYLANGFNATASVAVHTITNTHEWEKQFEAPLDFSSLEDEEGKLTINAIDNTLAALLKSKKSQKYQFPVSEFSLTNVQMGRIAFANSQKYKLPRASNPSGNVDVRKDDANSLVISTAYVEPADESTGYDGTSINRFFASIKTAPSPLIRIAFEGYVNCSLNTVRNNAVATLQLGYWVDDSNPHFQLWSNLCDNDITKEFRYGSVRNKWIGKSTHANYATLDALKAAAAARTDIVGLYPGYFGIVGSNAYPNESYWTGNTVYEYDGANWVQKTSPANYNKYILVSAQATLNALATSEYPMLQLDNSMLITNGTLTMTWTDPAQSTLILGCINPSELLQRIVSSISPGSTATIADDEAGLLAKTYISPAEVLREIPNAKVFTTFQQFAEWMETVFGYTYRVVGNEVQFVHRSAVFDDVNVKAIENVRGVKYSVDDGIIYTEVDAGYSKKEYGEINGRLETNFTNYYATGFNATDRKLSLISRYRADSYGIEFTIRKGEKDNETKDDKNDEDVFFLCAEMESGLIKYEASKNDAYAPSVCVANNAAYIAAFGNGAAVTLTMTSSDGNNELEDITIAAGTALFTAGELDFETDDMKEPADLNGLVQVDYKGYRYTGFISEAKARFGRQNGMEYKLIVKEITAL